MLFLVKFMFIFILSFNPDQNLMIYYGKINTYYEFSDRYLFKCILFPFHSSNKCKINTSTMNKLNENI